MLKRQLLDVCAEFLLQFSLTAVTQAVANATGLKTDRISVLKMK